jgi:chitodextrinase
LLPICCEHRTANSITLTWSAATDNVAVTGYDVICKWNIKIYRNWFNYNNGLTPNSSYSFYVTAKDDAENIRAQCYCE